MKHLKIVEQIIVVLILAVLIPFITIGFIISNISQQSVRLELANNTTATAQYIGSTVENYIVYSQSQLNQIASGFNYIPDPMEKIQYFDDIESKTNLFKDLDIVEKTNIPNHKYEIDGNYVKLYSAIDPSQKYFLVAKINIDILDKILGKGDIGGRKVYIFDSDNQNLISTNAPSNNIQDVLLNLNVPQNTKTMLFGGKKNTPKAYYKLDNPNWFVVVDTTKKVTAKTITKAKYRIILSLILAALSIFVIVGLYTYYLYINIRQLFKGIKAISEGNYDKKIHLIKRAFTPHEIIFLAKEFNYMANKIKASYKILREKNKKLEKLNEFRENMINSTSHEFRTPLTSIIGYTSRLLRHDIKLDEETKNQSLKTIKQQAQRLSRMVEDLLVIPQLDSYSLKYNIQEVDLASCLIRVLDYFGTRANNFDVKISSDLNYVWADENRLEQIIINLVDNALKYSLDDTPVKIIASNEGEFPVVKIINRCEKISDEIKEKLFDKFIRADSKLTRTTRGTGLGLYIVKGLCEAMKIDISFTSDNEFIMRLEFKDIVK